MNLLSIGLLAIFAQARQAPPDSIATVRSIVEAEQRFLAQWRIEWLSSDWEQWEVQEQGDRTGNVRRSRAGLENFRCNYAWRPPASWNKSTQRQSLIPSGDTWNRVKLGMCPSWIVDVPPVPDAGIVLDSALTAARRERIAVTREALIAQLHDAARTIPGDAFVAGQRVRFLLDQSYRSEQYWRDALKATTECQSERWWCESLRGLVLARRGMTNDAGAAFANARAARPDSVTCAANNVALLMDRNRIPVGITLPNTCAARSSLESRYWWLADPLWSDAVNERRVEHDARTISLLLTATLPKSERFDWGPKTGADAVAQMVIRYGWPSVMFWPAIVQNRIEGDPPNQRSLVFRPGIDSVDAMPSPPFATHEYSFNRVHVGPSWQALFDPFHAVNADWTFQAPEDIPLRDWWPSEHFARARPLVALREWQLQSWRRRDSLLLAVATRVTGTDEANGQSPTGWHAYLMQSSAPEHMTLVARDSSTPGNVLALSGTVPSASALVSIELTGALYDVRARFALGPESTLSSMRRGTRAISTPALIQLDSSQRVPSTARSAIPLMLPTSRVRRNDRVGLFWESYGFEDAAAVEIRLEVERVDRRGTFERIAASIGLGADERMGTRITWRERSAGVVDREVSTEILVHSRTLLLNLSTLRPGDYVVTVSVRAAANDASASSRIITIVDDGSK